MSETSNKSSQTKIRFDGGSVMIGLIVLGICIYSGIGRFADRDRSVVVKGLSEREVMADKVIWPIAYRLAGNDIKSLYNEIERSNAVIMDFLTSNGIPQDEITVTPASVTDIQAERYGYNNEDPFRYKAVSVVTVASDKIDLVRSLMTKQGDLLKKGVVTTGDDYQFQTVFSFNGLNDIKPEMVAEATKNARATAQKFAEDSDSEIGKIRSASQGQFSISDRDQNTPHIKVVRVVTTIEYSLKD
ncbi:MAG TPA: SIMPL domain-containing protein [Candidatus Coprenecus pullistercoris]|nr:SIMPL domain-containing protein [Candidatus Coprenecus pullistercoris]